MMHVKKMIIALTALFYFNGLISQQIVDNICMQVIGSNGLSAEKFGKHYDATLGEVMTATLRTTDGSVTVTQGFHQPECAQTSVDVTDLTAEWQLEVFPNPTIAGLHIRYQHPSSATLYTRVWNISGVLMTDWQALPSGNALDCTLYAAGIYLLELRDPDTGQKTIIRFVKTTF